MSNEKKQKPTLFVILLLVNCIAMVGMAFVVYQFVQKKAEEDKVAQIEAGEEAEAERSIASEPEYSGPVIPLETFVINLAGSKGRRIAKFSMEIELSSEDAQTEIERRKAQIRDIIIILLSSKTYEEINTREGMEFLRVEIKDTVNAFLTKGKINNVYFTEFLYN